MRPCKQALDFEILGDQVRKIVGVERVSKCVVFDVDSIFEVEILSENFSHYTLIGGTWNILLLNRYGEISVFTKFEDNLLDPGARYGRNSSTSL